MTFLANILLVVPLFSAVYAAPVAEPRAAINILTGSCDPWAVMKAAPYELQSNLWGINGASGNQCTVSIIRI